MRRKTRRCYLTKPPSMRWLVGVMAVVMVLLQVPAFMRWGRPGLGHLAWFLGVLYCYLPALVRSRRVAITADAKGCTEWLWPWRRRRIRWDEVTGVEVSEDSARIVTARGTIEFGPRVNNWLELAERARAATGQPLPSDVPDDTMCIPPEEVADWLGITPDDVLECRSDHFRRQMGLLRAVFLVEAGAMAALGLYAWAKHPAIAFAVLLPALLMAGMGWFMPRLVRRSQAEQQIEAVRATADALEVQDARGRWRRFAWGSLRYLIPFGRFQVLSTPEGDVALPPRLTNADRLLGAIEQAIAARRRGLALPRMTGEGVPEGAISRAGAVEAAVERGLSRSEGGEG